MIGNDWDIVLADEYKKEYFKKLLNDVESKYETSICYPEKCNIFRALKLTPYSDVKVVILGQDPYHGEGEANGLCFSVFEGIKCPPSLRNIFKELESDVGIKRTDTDLTSWANQGVLLLNTIMSVEKDKPLSHSGLGWEIFTDEIIKKIALKKDVIFVLWGNYARGKKCYLLDNKVIESAHPSPLSASRGFFGSKPFSKINEILLEENKKTIDW